MAEPRAAATMGFIVEECECLLSEWREGGRVENSLLRIQGQAEPPNPPYSQFTHCVRRGLESASISQAFRDFPQKKTDPDRCVSFLSAC